APKRSHRDRNIHDHEQSRPRLAGGGTRALRSDMSAEDFKGHPEDRDLYLRLLIERDGSPECAADERDPGRRTPQVPDRDTAQRVAELEEAISTTRRPRRRAA
ncbi:hypothetical protein, partial [Streptomyces sp. NPDC127084]|uniref:hypothetical protein n=1 Tax=Streptomyces sp. NPDC127084 TaxID=3347133 RepID=UPI003669EC75